MIITIKATGPVESDKTIALKKLLGNLEIQGFSCRVNEHEIVATKDEAKNFCQISQVDQVIKTFVSMRNKGVPVEVAERFTALIHKLK